jgi:hypothetical protein
VDAEIAPMVVSYEIVPVQFKGGKIRPVWRQTGSDVRRVPVTAELNEKYLALLATLNIEPSSE